MANFLPRTLPFLILEHVDLVLTIASSEIRSGNNDKAGKLVQLAQRATVKLARR
jgi:hypothetical protein